MKRRGKIQEGGSGRAGGKLAANEIFSTMSSGQINAMASFAEHPCAVLNATTRTRQQREADESK